MQYALGGVVTLATAYEANSVLTTATSPQAILQPPSNGTPIVVDLTLQSSGMYQGTWTVPSDAVLGTWTVLYQGVVNGVTVSRAGDMFAVVASVSVNPSSSGYCAPVDIINRIPNLLQPLTETPAGPINGTNTVFTLSRLPQSLSAVVLGGITLSGASYSISGSTLTLTSAPRSDQLPFQVTYTYCTWPTSVLQDFINRVSADIDAALANRYSVPFASPYPLIVVQIAVDLAASTVYQAIHQGDGSTEELPMYKVLYNEATTRLMRLAEGKFNLPGLTQAAPALTSNLQIGPRLNTLRLRNWHPARGSIWGGYVDGPGPGQPPPNW